MLILIFFLPGLVEMIHDYYVITHLKRSDNKLITTLMALAVAVGCWVWFSSVTNAVEVLGAWHSLTYCILLGFTFRFCIFNYGLNLMRGKDWDHLGNNAWDNFERATFNKWFWLVTRVLLFIGSFPFYYITNDYYGIK